MALIDSGVLRGLTEAAIRRGQEDILVSETKRRENEVKRKIEAVERATQILLKGLPELIQKATAMGKRSESVLNIKEADVDRPKLNLDARQAQERNFLDPCQPSWLRGAAKIVYQDCSEARLRPTIVAAQSPNPEDSGFQIRISW